MPEVTPIPLAQLTTLRTGGAPARMIDASTADELVDALRDGVGRWRSLARPRRRFQPLRRRRAVRGHRRARAHRGDRADAVAPAGIRPAAGAGRATTGTPSSRTPCAKGSPASRRCRGSPAPSAPPRCRTSAPTARRSSRPSSRSSSSTSRRATCRRVPAGRARTRLPHVGAQAPLRLGAGAARGDPVGDARARRGRPRRAADRGGAAAHRARPAPGRRGVGGVDPRSRDRDAPPQGHGARRRGPRHLQRRARSSRTRSSRRPSPGRFPPSARGGRSRPTSTRCS